MSETARNILKSAISRCVTLGVIDRLKPNGVHEANDKGLAAALGSVHLTLDSGEPHAAPQNASQDVDALVCQLKAR